MDKQTPVTTLDVNEQLVADFIKMRVQKVLKDIDEMVKNGAKDVSDWQDQFAHLIRVYGRDSEEPFKWYKYYLREGKLPLEVALPILIQIYMDGSVDKGFVNILAKVAANEPEEAKADRKARLSQVLADKIGEDGKVLLFRGEFKKPFGLYEDEIRSVEKAFCFTTSEKVAGHYAVCWYPEESAVISACADLDTILWYTNFNEEENVIILPVFKGGQLSDVNRRIVTKDDFKPPVDKGTAQRAYLQNIRK